MKIVFILALFVFGLVAQAQEPQSIDFTPPHSFTEGIEGPATDHNGNLYAVNFNRQGTIGKVTPQGEATIFVTLPEGSIANGIRFGKDKKMYVADYTNHNILKIHPRTRKISVFAHQPDAHQPNDLAIAPNGTIYASDPNWANDTGKIWKVTKKGFELLEENMGTTNGIEVSPDGKTLYVNESVQRKIWAYDLDGKGNISNKKKFYQFEDYGMDGMRCHPNGDLYVCRYDKGTVAVFSADGYLLKEYQLKGKKPSNLTFDPTYTKIYVTMADRGCVELVEIQK